jgi:hypothetical protein
MPEFSIQVGLENIKLDEGQHSTKKNLVQDFQQKKIYFYFKHGSTYRMIQLWESTKKNIVFGQESKTGTISTAINFQRRKQVN